MSESERTMIVAGRRLAIMPSIGDWYVSYSPRNDNSNAEGPWEEWVELARRILEAEGRRVAETVP
jgi:hypothetical protein